MKIFGNMTTCVTKVFILFGVIHAQLTMSNRALVKDTTYQSLTPITTSYNQLLYTSNTININIKFKHSNISKIICNQGFNQVRKHVPNIEAGAAIGTSTKIEAGEAIGIQPPKGVLLHGPPGSGKTLLAHAIAGESEVGLIKVSAPELVAGLSGQSE
eukprot:618163_1